MSGTPVDVIFAELRRRLEQKLTERDAGMFQCTDSKSSYSRFVKSVVAVTC